MGKSPKKYVKENKENYQKMNVNQIQKVRMKLKQRYNNPTIHQFY